MKAKITMLKIIKYFFILFFMCLVTASGQNIDTTQIDIDAQYIQNSIPGNARAFISITSKDLPIEYKSTIDALDTAITLLAKYFIIDKITYVVIGTNPFNVKLGDQTFKMILADDVLGYSLTGNNLIFLEISKIKNYEFDLQIAIYLEEFVHCYCRVKDENLVKIIVANMYPPIKILLDAMNKKLDY